MKRDRIISLFFRLSQSPTFDGFVIKGANYLPADDMFTLGGTLESLRGVIEGRGGTVVGRTAPGEKEGDDVKISLAKDTLDERDAAHHGPFATPVTQRADFALECLTQPEGRNLLEQSSADPN